MENNLDDILIDPLEEKQKKPKSKRWVLIGVALVLLIAVVAIALYFAFMKKEEAQGLEAVHSELERFESVAQKQSLESQKDDEFDKLIAEIKAKHQDTSSPKQPEIKQEQKNKNSKVADKEQSTDLIKALQRTQEPQKQESKKPNPQKQVANAKTQEVKKPQVKGAQIQETQIKETQIKETQIKETQAKGVQPKEVRGTQARDVAKETQAKDAKGADLAKNSASNAFNSLEIPQGFYLQVGVFEKKPNAEFLDKLSAFSYRVEKFNNKGKIVNRYLIGPFATREEAEIEAGEVRSKITRPVIVKLP